MLDVLNMGGYGAYVWSAFGLTLAGMVGLLVATVSAGRRAEREHEALRARLRPRRNNRATPKRPHRAAMPDDAASRATAGS